MKKLIWFLLTLSCAAQVHTVPNLDSTNAFTKVNSFAAGAVLGPTTFASLSTPPFSTAANGTVVILTDGTPGPTCTGFGSGATAVRIAGAWNCGSTGGAVSGSNGFPMVGTGASIASSPMFWDAAQFSGADNCAKTLNATNTPINSNNSTVTFAWSFIAASYPCVASPVSPTLVETLFLGPGQMQMTGFSVVAGGQTEIEGTSLGYGANGGTVLQMQTTGFLPGAAVNYGAGTYASPTAYSGAATYNRGLGVFDAANSTAYVSVFPGNQSGHLPSGPNPTFWSLRSSEPSPIMAVYQKGVGGADVEATMFHRISGFCQYTAGDVPTDGCVGYMNLWGQELTRTDRIKIKNATVIGFWLDGQTVADSGPYTDGIISWDNPGGVANTKASKVNGSDASTQQATISSITVAGTVGSVILSGSPAFTVWRGELMDCLNCNATWSYLNGSDVGETANTHGFWQVYSVQDSTHFLIAVAAGTPSCTVTCGTALFYPTGITVSSPTSTTGANRGIDGYTINCSNCNLAKTNWSYFPPLAIAMSGGTYPLSNIHTEGFRVGVCVGCFGVSNGEVIRNAFLTTNTRTSVLISNNYSAAGVPVTNLDLWNIGSTNVAGPPLTTYTIIDKINGNLITNANNPVVHHYWLDSNGLAYFEGGNCSEMTLGWCLNQGSTTQTWCYYSAGVKTTCGGGNIPVNLAATGATPCDRLNTNAAAYPGGRATSSQTDYTGAVQACGAVNVDNSNSTTLLPGGAIWSTNVGWNIGDRQSLIGDNIGNGTATVTTQTGFEVLATSTFPTTVAAGGGLTASGTNTIGASTFTVALSGSATSTLQIPPGSRFIVSGVEYTILSCNHTGVAPCSTSQSTAGASNYYTLAPSGTAVLRITPVLAGTIGAGTAVTPEFPIMTFGDQNTQKNGSGSSQQQLAKNIYAFSTNGWGIGWLRGIEPQENSVMDHVVGSQVNHPFVEYGAIHAAPNTNDSAIFTSAVCTVASGFLSALEISASEDEWDDFAAFASASSCTPAAFPNGLIHITTNPLSGTGNGTLRLKRPHCELNGDATSGDCIYIDSPSGNIIIQDGQGCSSATCKNFVHVASTFVGTLTVENTVPTVSAHTTNFVQDDVNGNTIPFSAIGGGNSTGYYTIDNSGIAMTNLVNSCTNMAKGWIVNGGVWEYCSALSTVRNGFDASGKVIAALLATATKCAAAGSAANPSLVACAAAPAGLFSCATNASTGTCVVSTTAVTASSVIHIQPDSTLGTALSVTCNTTADTGLTAPRVSARSAGVSFTITLGTFTTNPECFSYVVVN